MGFIMHQCLSTFFVCIDFTFLGVIYSKGKPVVVFIVGYTLGIRY